MSNDSKIKITIEAEANILSIIMHSKGGADEIFSTLDVDDFIEARHRIIFEEIRNLFNARSVIDLTTVANALLKNDALSQVGGVEYLTTLFENYISDANLEDYTKIVINSTMLRKLNNVIGQINKQIANNDPVESIVNLAERSILEVNNIRQKNQFQNTAEIVKEAMLRIEQLSSTEETLTGTPSGFNELDRLTSGFQPGDLIILAARPSMGKTALALNFAFNSSVEYDKGVAVFSLEMPAEQLVVRMLGCNAQIDSGRMRNGKGLKDNDWKNLTKVADKLKKVELFIDDTPGLSIMELQSKLRKLTREHDIDMVIIDYLQLLTSGVAALGESRQQEVSMISRQLKAIARELGIPVICLSQLSRSVEKREDKKPIMSDLRDSGAIEQDADIIMFLYREEYYEYANPEEMKKPAGETEDKAGKIAQLIVAKHRNGPTGTINLFFVQKWGTFEDMLN